MNNIELFNQIYEKYYKSIVSYFSRRFDSDEAEDLAQITFMKLWGYLPTLGYIKKEKSLIFKIAKNVLADRLRKNNFADSLDELESIKCLEVFDDITSVEIQQILLKFFRLVLRIFLGIVRFIGIVFLVLYDYNRYVTVSKKE